MSLALYLPEMQLCSKDSRLGSLKIEGIVFWKGVGKGSWNASGVPTDVCFEDGCPPLSQHYSLLASSYGPLSPLRK